MSETAQDLIEHIRQSLRSKGDAGIFLLDQIDRALASGVEEERSLKENRSKKFVQYRPLNEMETLWVMANVLQEYLVTLPDAIQSYLRHVQTTGTNYTQFEISMDSDVLPEGQTSQPLISLNELKDIGAPVEVRQEFQTLFRILPEPSRK